MTAMVKGALAPVEGAVVDGAVELEVEPDPELLELLLHPAPAITAIHASKASVGLFIVAPTLVKR